MSRRPGSGLSGLWLVACAALGIAACDDDPGGVADGAVDARPIDDGPVDARAPDVARPVDRGLDAAPTSDAAVDRGPPDLDGPPAADAEADTAPAPADLGDVGSPFRDAAPVDPIAPCTVFECACAPGAVEPCYVGPPETDGVGPCRGGTRTCADDGSGFGACAGHQPPVGEDCRTPADEDCDGLTPPCDDTWVRLYAADASQAVRSVAVAPGGDVLVLLDFDATVNLGAGPVTAHRAKADVGLARYDRQGNPVWSRSWGNADDDFAGQIAVGPAGEIAVAVRIYGNIRVAGQLADSRGLDDMMLIMLEPDGRERWGRRIGGGGRDGSERLIIDDDGQVLLTGRFEGEVRFGERVFTSAGASDAFAAVIDGATGEVVVARQAGGAGADAGWGIARGADGAIYAAGRFEQIVSWGGEPIQSAGAGDVFVVALEADGRHRWTRRFGGPGDEGVYDMVRDPADGALYVFGWFSAGAVFAGPGQPGDPLPNAGASDFYVMRIDADGAVQAAAFGDAADQIASPFPASSYGAMALGPDGLYLAGPFAGSAFGLQAVGGVDGFSARLDRGLVLRDALGFGTGFSEMALDVAVDPGDGAVVFGGRFYSRVGPVIGPHGPLPGAASSDGFVTRLIGR